MLIEFRVENHRSLRDEQVLTMEAGHVVEEDDSRPRTIDGHNKKLLPATVIYGPNASGKSNVLAAMAFMREAVLMSHRRWDPEGGIPCTPFAWGPKRHTPSMFEATFVVGATKCEYGFCVNDEIVEEEWLFAWPNNRKQVWLERDAASFRFGEHLNGPNTAVKEVTRKNALFLSAAAQHGHQQLISLYTWFRNIFPVNVLGRGFAAPLWLMSDALFSADEEQRTLFRMDETEVSLAARIRQLLRSADTGIVDVKRIVSEGEYRGRINRRHRILLQHQADDDGSWLELDPKQAYSGCFFGDFGARIRRATSNAANRNRWHCRSSNCCCCMASIFLGKA